MKEACSRGWEVYVHCQDALCCGAPRVFFFMSLNGHGHRTAVGWAVLRSGPLVRRHLPVSIMRCLPLDAELSCFGVGCALV